MKSLLIILTLFFLHAPVYGGEITTKFLVDFESEDGEVLEDKATLAINYKGDDYWINEAVSRDSSQEASFENFLGGGWKNKITERWATSLGILWQYDGEKDQYLGSFEVEYKKDNSKVVIYWQPYIDEEGYIEKGSLSSGNFIQQVEYRSREKRLIMKTGIEF